MVRDFYDKQGFVLESEDEHGNKAYVFQIPEDDKPKNRYIQVNAGIFKSINEVNK
jgi:hypothetical protein